MLTTIFVLLLAQAPPATPPVVIKTIQTTDGQSITGRVLNEGMSDLQIRTDDQRVHLFRKAANDRYRPVTSQKDWPTYHGDPSGNRYTTLTQINKDNVSRLAPKWIFPLPNVTQVENTPVVVDGLMYVSSANEVWALDAGSGRQVWHYQRPRTRGLTGNAAIGFNRGVAISGDRLFMLTDNAHMIALDRRHGELLWETEMADWHQNYNGTSAPLAVGNLVISGSAGGDEGVRGFVAAYDAETGKEVWHVWTVPNPGEPGSETWKGKQTEHRGGASWMTGTYDSQLDLVYWPTGNPGLDYNGDERQGDNLYSDSILALEAKTGKMRWYFQFTPHDIHDWDAQEPPVLVDTQWQGQPRKLLLQANRNGFFYVLDRTNGQFLLGKQFLKNLTWANGLDAKGRPILNDLKENAQGETYVCPGFQGGANWYSTSFNPITGLYYFSALERCNLFQKRSMEWEAGKGYMGGTARPAPGESFVKSVRAINIQTGEVAWDLPQVSGAATSSAGVLSTASGLVFFGENSGSLMAADAATGKVLWDFPTNHVWKSSPMTYVFDNEQYIAIPIGQSIVAFALPQQAQTASLQQGPDHPSVTVQGKTYTPQSILSRNMGTPEDQTAQFPPYKIIGNIYYVGTRTLSSFLIVTPQGNILIDSTYERNVQTIEKSVQQLGFKFSDTKIVLGSHAHGDHQEGDALVKQRTGAQVMAMAEDVPALQAIKPGGKEHPIDKILHDGDSVTLGGTTLVAHLTPGHTRGCTTWTLKAQEGGKTYDVVINCSLRSPATLTPAIINEFNRSFKLVRALPCDVQLGDHPAQFNMQEKYAKLQSGGPNPYIDRAGCTLETDIEEAMFRAILKEQGK